MTKKGVFWSVLLAGVFLLFSANAFAEKRFEGRQWLLSVGPFMEYVKWEEDVSGGKDVEENGFRHGLSASFTVYPEQPRGDGWFNYWTACLSGRFFFSRSIDYDGAYWDGTAVEGDVHHSGWKIEALFGYGRKEADRVVLPFLAVEWNEWERNAVFDGGYLEAWEAGIAKVGLIYAFRYGKGVLELAGSLGTGFREKNKAYFSQVVPGASNVTVKPDLSRQIELSATYYFGSLFAQGYWTYRSFDKSEKEILAISTPAGVQTVPVYQPESTVNMLGFMLGFQW